MDTNLQEVDGGIACELRWVEALNCFKRTTTMVFLELPYQCSLASCVNLSPGGNENLANDTQTLLGWYSNINVQFRGRE
jgi:hypothetical protein